MATSGDEDEAAAFYASPPCFMHELDPGRPGMVSDRQQQTDVARWRKAERARLIAERRAIDVAARRSHAEAIAARLEALLGSPEGRTIGLYWPIRGEPDLRPWMETIAARGGVCALPLVVAADAPLIFRTWRRGEPLRRDPWNVPVPAEGDETVPDVMIAPVVGFDRRCYRLGYGTGFFDRTLAAARPRPHCIGVGYALLEIPTIYPQPHDVPMDAVVTEREAIDTGG